MVVTSSLRIQPLQPGSIVATLRLGSLMGVEVRGALLGKPPAAAPLEAGRPE